MSMRYELTANLVEDYVPLCIKTGQLIPLQDYLETQDITDNDDIKADFVNYMQLTYNLILLYRLSNRRTKT